MTVLNSDWHFMAHHEAVLIGAPILFDIGHTVKGKCPLLTQPERVKDQIKHIYFGLYIIDRL